MSEDLVNQITLNFLISKSQLEKLNKKMKYDTDNKKKTSIEVYGPRIKDLFNHLLDNESPNDLLQDVKTGFDFFLEKCIYYFKIHDDNSNLDTERDTEDKEDIVENNTLDELDDEPEEDNEDDTLEDNEDDILEDNEDDTLEDEALEQHDNKPNIKQKIRKNAWKTNGVNNIQQLPLEWFQRVNQPSSQHLREINRKNKNINK